MGGFSPSKVCRAILPREHVFSLAIHRTSLRVAHSLLTESLLCIIYNVYIINVHTVLVLYRRYILYECEGRYSYYVLRLKSAGKLKYLAIAAPPNDCSSVNQPL